MLSLLTGSALCPCCAFPMAPSGRKTARFVCAADDGPVLSGDLLLEGGTVIDPRDGSLIENASVLIDQGLIVAIDTTASAKADPSVQRIDATGNLTICGRSKDLIKSGGEWINPAEIEDIVGRISTVGQVAVVGRFDPKWGERPVLIVEMRQGQAMDASALLQALRGKVADWWLPDQIVQIGAMPLAATGKIDKIRLRADYAGGAGVDGRSVA